jgi:hypothetical protein
MRDFDTSTIPANGHWKVLSSDDACWIEELLQRELYPGHALFGRALQAVARRYHRTRDVMFYLGEMAPRFALVSVTFTVDHGADLPRTTFFDTLEDWICDTHDA